jgi:hypothetical protein
LVKTFEPGKVYELTEDDFYGKPRVLVGRFVEVLVYDKEDVRHVFLLADGRTGALIIEDWIVEEGSELIWALG